MLQRILVPLDGSVRAEYALPVAVRLAHATGGHWSCSGCTRSCHLNLS
jgi:nucleotide-binding universal stress UspA family protein